VRKVGKGVAEASRKESEEKKRSSRVKGGKERTLYSGTNGTAPSKRQGKRGGKMSETWREDSGSRKIRSCHLVRKAAFFGQEGIKGNLKILS